MQQYFNLICYLVTSLVFECQPDFTQVLTGAFIGYNTSCVAYLSQE